MTASAYSPQPSTLALLNAKTARGIDTPASIMRANCSSCPGRASCTVSAQVIASNVKSSMRAPGVAFGLSSGSTNSAFWPVLPISCGGLMCGAGIDADSASLASRITAARCGQRHDLLATDDVLDGREPRLVGREQLVVGDGLPLERAQHVAVVGRRQLALGRHQSRDRLHLVARLHETDQRAVDQLLRLDLDAEAAQVVGVDRGRQPVVLARPRQHLLAHPVGVLAQLPLEHREVLFPALEAALPERLADAVHVARLVRERLVDLDRPRAGQARGGEALAHALLGELDERLVARFAAGVLAQARQRGGVALRVDARVEQPLEAAKQGLVDVEPRQHVLAVQPRGRDLLARRLHQDPQVLLDPRVGRSRDPRLEVRGDALEVGLEPFVVTGLEIEDLLVVAFDAQCGGLFRGVAGQDLEQGLGVGVALGEPVLGGERGRACERGDERHEGAQGSMHR